METIQDHSELAIHDGPKGPSFNLVQIWLVYVNSFINTSCYGVKIISKPWIAQKIPVAL